MNIGEVLDRFWTKVLAARYEEHQAAEARQDRDAAEHVERAKEGIKDMPRGIGSH